MDFLKNNFEQVRKGPMKKALDSLERAFVKFDVDFYLIGAFARDMWMDHIEHLPLRRTTRDIDFSLYINEIRDFYAIKEYLSVEEGFQHQDEPHRMVAPDQTIVDLLPFGGVEDSGSVYLDGKSPVDISVFGNLQVLTHAATVETENSEFKICTLPGLCIMKLISGHEKSDRLAKDLADFYYILENYFEIAGDTIYDVEYEDLIDDDFSPSLASAKLLGRQISVILAEDIKLKIKVVALLSGQRRGFDVEDIEQMFAQEPGDKAINRMKLICLLLSEIEKV